MSIISGVGAGLGGAGDSGGALGSFTLDGSLRFNRDDSPKLVFDPNGSATLSTKSTVSVWFKRSGLATSQTIFAGETGAVGYDLIQVGSDGYIKVLMQNPNSYGLRTSAIIRDPSAWYHLVCECDTTLATAADRLKIYVNGDLQTLTSVYGNYPQDHAWYWSRSGASQNVGRSEYNSNSFDGYLSEFNFIDGQALDPTSFGETKDGVWIPKEYSGSYGNNGFHLPMTQTKNAGFSALFDTRDTSTMTHSDSSAYDIGSSDDFTIEFFFNTPDVGANYGNFIGQYATSGPHHLVGYDFRSSTRKIYWYTGNGAAFEWNVTGDVTLVANKWHHMVFQRDGTTLRAYIDGTRLTTVIDSAGNTGYTVSSGKSTDFNKAYDLSQITIGDPHGQGFSGYISNVRYVIGATIYADSDSNITVPTATLTAVTGTKLLSCVNGTVGDDISSENNDASVTSVTASTVNPFGTFNFFQDASGNNRFFSRSNLVDTDAVPDSPTNNFATLNPLDKTIGTPTISQGNLRISSSGGGYDGSYATIAVTSGKWYAEFLYISGDNRGAFGVVREDRLSYVNGSAYIGSIDDTYGIDLRARAYTGTSATSSSGSQLFDGTDFDTGDIGLLCFDVDNGKLWFGRRDVSGSTTIWYDSSGNNNGDPSAGSNPTFTFTATGSTWFIGCHDYAGTELMANFGQDGSFASNITSQGASDANGIGNFNYIETGFLALCTSNLPDITIGPGQSSQADDFFNTVLYTGNASSRSITGVGFQPDWVWLKPRSDTDNHVFFDSVRGVQKFLYSNLGNSEATRSGDGLSSFDSDGFSIGDWNNINENTQTYVAWNWKAGGAPSGDNSAAANAEPTAGSAKIDGSNRSGAFSGPPSIAIKRLSANTTSGFSIVKWTGTGSAGTIPHGLGAVPHFYVVKNLTDDSTNWQVYHRGIASDAETDYLYLNEPNAADDSDDWNDTAPTANVFSVKTHNQVNETGDDYIAYVFAPIEGYSKFSSYRGNGSSDGTFVFTGFRPAWLLVKTTSSSNRWVLFDSVRSTANPVEEKHELNPNDTSAEGTSGTDCFDFLSNGFKLRRSGDVFNTSGHTYIYLAFAEAPFKSANAR